MWDYYSDLRFWVGGENRYSNTVNGLVTVGVSGNVK